MEEFDPMIAEDEFGEDEILVLTGADGEEVEFVEVAGIAYDGGFYKILQPVELPEGMEDDEAIVFCLTEDDEGGERYSIVLDDEVIDGVFAIYNDLLDKAIAEQE